MLYFSKLKLVTIYFVIFFLSFFALVNFIDDDKNFLFSKKINLGLDLQGGSYLLLEVDSLPIIKQKLQGKLMSLRKYLKDEKIKYKNLNIKNEKIKFQILDGETEKFEEFFLNKDNIINIYYNQYRSYEMNLNIDKDTATIEYSKFGIIEMKKNILEQSLIIVARRIDEVVTNISFQGKVALPKSYVAVVVGTKSALELIADCA